MCDGAALSHAKHKWGIRVRGADRQQRGIRVCDEAATTWIHGSTRVVVVASCSFFKFLGVCVRTIAGVALVVCVTEQLCHKRITDL